MRPLYLSRNPPRDEESGIKGPDDLEVEDADANANEDEDEENEDKDKENEQIAEFVKCTSAVLLSPSTPAVPAILR